MAKDNRIQDAKGRRLNYTCENRRFLTNVHKGSRPKPRTSCGSAFRRSLYVHGDYSLWLEHVTDKTNPDDPRYWLMWYRKGIPTVPLSSVFSRDDMRKMKGLFAKLDP
jgi:hypothetical protein